MIEDNRYAPPTANVEDIGDPGVRTTYGVGLSASLFWRIAVFHLVILAFAGFWLVTGAGDSQALVRFKPTVFNGLAGGALAGSLLVFRPGLLFLVGGGRLRIPMAKWRRFSWGLCGYYVVMGIATDMCVETTARDAADRGFNVIVVEDATATFFEHHHRAALSGFARVFGQVWDSERVLAAL